MDGFYEATQPVHSCKVVFSIASSKIDYSFYCKVKGEKSKFALEI